MNYCYIGLLKSTKLGLIEPTRETNYRRVEMAPHDWFLNGDVAINAVDIRFPTVLKDWGIITYFGIFDSLQDGNFIVLGTFQRKVPPIGEGDNVVFNAGDIEVSLDELKIEADENIG